MDIDGRDPTTAEALPQPGGGYSFSLPPKETEAEELVRLRTENEDLKSKLALTEDELDKAYAALKTAQAPPVVPTPVVVHAAVVEEAPPTVEPTPVVEPVVPVAPVVAEVAPTEPVTPTE